MKKGFYSIGGIIILLIAAFIFVLVPAFAGQADRSMRLPEYGSFNGESIKFEEGSEFFNLANQVVQEMQQQGYDFSNQQIATFYYSMAFAQAFNRIVGPLSLQDLSTSSGYTATESWVDRALINRYYNEAGEFSQAIYNATPDNQKRENQVQVVKDLEVQRSYEDIFGSLSNIGGYKLYGLKNSSPEIEFIRKMGAEVHGFEYVAFDMRSYPDEKALEYAQANKAKFAKYDLTVITVDDEAKAQDVLKRINNSEITFDDAVTMYSTKMLGNIETGKITMNRRYQIANQLKDENASTVFALTTGATSEPIELKDGWAIFRCDGDIVQIDLNDESELTTVKNYIFSYENGAVEDYYTAQANDFIAAAVTTDFETAAEKSEISIYGLIQPFALNYNNTTLLGHSSINDTAELNGATSNENFLKTAFSLKEGEISSPIVLTSSNNIIVLRCKSIEEGGTSVEDAPRLIGDSIADADYDVVNSAIVASPKIKYNSDKFMAAFTGKTE